MRYPRQASTHAAVRLAKHANPMRDVITVLGVIDAENEVNNQPLVKTRDRPLLIPLQIIAAAVYCRHCGRRWQRWAGADIS